MLGIKQTCSRILRIGLIPFDVLPNDVDKAASNIMVDMWANFATYGKPIPSPDEMLEGGKKELESLVRLIHFNNRILNCLRQRQ